MSKFINTHSGYLPFLGQKIGYTPSANAQCVMCVDAEGTPLAGTLFDCYNIASIHAHVWVGEVRPSPEWYFVSCDYPFRLLGVKKVIGQIASTNEQAIHHAESVGYKLEAEVKDYYPDGGSLLVYTLTKENCRILTSPRWEKARRNVLGKLGV